MNLKRCIIFCALLGTKDARSASSAGGFRIIYEGCLVATVVDHFVHYSEHCPVISEICSDISRAGHRTKKKPKVPLFFSFCE